MKFVPVICALAIASALAGCAQKSADVPVPVSNPNVPGAPVAQQNIALPNVSGTIWIRQRIALPPDSVLTVTLSDVSRADAPSKVIAQKANLTNGKQAPFSFVLPFNPAQIQPDAHIILSAAITRNGKLMFVTDTIQQAINNGGKKIDLTLVPVQQTAMPVQSGSGAVTTVPTTSPTQVTPSSAKPAPVSL